MFGWKRKTDLGTKATEVYRVKLVGEKIARRVRWTEGEESRSSFQFVENWAGPGSGPGFRFSGAEIADGGNVCGPVSSIVYVD